MVNKGTDILNRRCLNCMSIFNIPEGQEKNNFRCPYCGFVENTPPKVLSYLRPGVMLNNRYTIGTVIGAGGFGITYRAWDNLLEHIVAIKEYFPKGVVSRNNSVDVYVASAEEREQLRKGKERFLKEARGLARFNQNPTTVAIYDFFEAGGTAYMCMEYLKGKNMKEVYAENNKPLPFEMLLKLGVSMCDALEEVHNAGIIHRDISPDNVFYCDNGTYKLIDFGAMKQKFGNAAESSTVILKQGYAPLEQYSNVGNIGPWTDIYSLGATLYFLSTGQVPLQATDRVIEDTVVPPVNLNPAISTAFSDVIVKALSIRAENRYQNVKAFKEAMIAASDVGATSVVHSSELSEIVSSERGKSAEKESFTSLSKEDSKNTVNNQNDISKINNSPKKTGKILLFILVPVLIVGSILVFSILFTKKEVSYVVGMQQNEAENILSEKGFETKINYEDSYEVESGKVITQSVSEGTKLSKGSVIELTVCENELVTIPELIGKTSDEAQKAVEDAGLKVEIKTNHSDDIEEGKVISQNPASDAEADESAGTDGNGGIVVGKTITIIVSEGPEGVQVPDVSGKSYDEASEILKSAGLEVKKEEEFSDTVDEKNVISQDVSAGSKVKKGTVVKLVVSKGVEITTEAETTAQTSAVISSPTTESYYEPETTEAAPPPTYEEPTTAEDNLSGFDN